MKKKKDKRDLIDKYQGWTKLLPNKEFEEYKAFMKVKQIYDALTKKKGDFLMMSKFVKIHKV